METPFSAGHYSAPNKIVIITVRRGFEIAKLTIFSDSQIEREPYV
jgi:hypothetical protein